MHTFYVLLTLVYIFLLFLLQQQQIRQEEQEKKKMPFSKPIPKNFQNSWNDVSSGAPVAPPPNPNFQENIQSVPPGCLSLQVLLENS